MSQNSIHLAFLNEVHGISEIDLVYEGGTTYEPREGIPYGELYFLPADNKGVNIDNPDYLARGIFQITLRYPTNEGLRNILDQTDIYVNHFYKGSKFKKFDVEVRVDETPKVLSLSGEGDRLVYIVSIPYKAYILPP